MLLKKYNEQFTQVQLFLKKTVVFLLLIDIQMQIIQEKLAKNPYLSSNNASLTFLIVVLEAMTKSSALPICIFSKTCIPIM